MDFQNNLVIPRHRIGSISQTQAVEARQIVEEPDSHAAMTVGDGEVSIGKGLLPSSMSLGDWVCNLLLQVQQKVAAAGLWPQGIVKEPRRILADSVSTPATGGCGPAAGICLSVTSWS